MANLGRKVMWMVAASAASRMVRGATRGAMHDGMGRTRLPTTVRRRSGFGTGLAMAAGASALMALGDVLREQGGKAARAK
jgi:hypothetical protein